MQEVARRLLLVVLVLSVVCFSAYRSESRGHADGTTNRLETRVTFGFPWPWYERLVEHEVSDGRERTTEVSGVRVSLTWGFLPLAFAAGYGVYRLHLRTTEGAREHREQAPTPEADVRNAG